VFASQNPSPEEIVAHLIAQDDARQASIGPYTWTSEYVLDNKQRHAEMQVRWSRGEDGVKRYEVIYQRGDGAVREHVFRKLLSSEVEASQPEFRGRVRLNAVNYAFRLTGVEEIQGRAAYVFEIEPKTDSKYLTKGRIWVDAEDYAVVQAEGSPSKRPSFWTNSVSFVQTFQKTGNYWMAASNRSVTEAKLFGKADLAIRHFDYQLGLPMMASAK
jgi:hypothetical protein